MLNSLIHGIVIFAILDLVQLVIITCIINYSNIILVIYSCIGTFYFKHTKVLPKLVFLIMNIYKLIVYMMNFR